MSATTKLPQWTAQYPGLQYYTQPTSGGGKFWAIWKSKGCFMTFWGRIGASPQTSNKNFHSNSRCGLEFNKIIDQKLGKGYKLKGTVNDKNNPILEFPNLGHKIVPGKEHDTIEPKLGSVLDMLELD